MWHGAQGRDSPDSARRASAKRPARKPAATSAGVLRVVLGDQCTRNLAALRDLDPARDVVLMAEVTEECTYVRHHPKNLRVRDLLIISVHAARWKVCILLVS